MNRPDYIIIGAMKCGTSTLAAQLGQQQGLFMTTPKEPNYFSDDAIFAKGTDWYSALFDAAAAGDIKGEASTHYTKQPDYPQTLPRMTAALPDVKLVYMIRNPMVRLVSHYIHAWSEGEVSTPLDQALTEHGALVDYGRYGWQIAPFIEVYGAGAVLLTSLERLKAEPDAELARIAAHLGHKGAVSWIKDQATHNISSQRVRKFPLHGLLVGNPVATALRRALVPQGLRDKIRASRQMADRPEIPQAARAGLEARFLEDRAQLAQYFPGDATLDMAYPFAS